MNGSKIQSFFTFKNSAQNKGVLVKNQNAVSFMQVAAEIFGYHKESMVTK